MRRIRVLVADAQRMFAEGVAGSLRTYTDLAVFEDYPTTGPEAVESVRRRRPNIAVIDYWMPEMGGPAIAAAVAARVPRVKVILLSALVAAPNIHSAIKSGAVGLLPKGAGIDQLAEAIRSAHRGDEPVLAKQLQNMVDRLGDKESDVETVRRRLAALTPREQEVLRLLGFGFSNDAVAKKLFISVPTVKDHVHNLLKKTGQSQVRQVLALARYSGWITE